MAIFELKVIPKTPAFGDRGVYYEIEAETWAKACSIAKKKAKDIDMVYDRHDGPLQCIRA